MHKSLDSDRRSLERLGLQSGLLDRLSYLPPDCRYGCLPSLSRDSGPSGLEILRVGTRVSEEERSPSPIESILPSGVQSEAATCTRLEVLGEGPASLSHLDNRVP